MFANYKQSLCEIICKINIRTIDTFLCALSLLAIFLCSCGIIPDSWGVAIVIITIIMLGILYDKK